MLLSIGLKGCPSHGTCTSCSQEDVALLVIQLMVDGASKEVARCLECWKELDEIVVLRSEEFKGLPKIDVKKVSVGRERRIAKQLGGKAQPGSGNKPYAKGDVRVVGSLRLEHKFTRNASYSVKRADLNKIRSETGIGEEPAFQIDFLNPVNLAVEDSWVLMPFNTWLSYASPPEDK